MTITVLSAYRRYGIASQLLEQAIKDCMKARNVSVMTLHVQASNEAALAFYKKHGFEEVERKEKYYTELDDADAIVLNRKIDLSTIPESKDSLGVKQAQLPDKQEDRPSTAASKKNKKKK